MATLADLWAAAAAGDGTAFATFYERHADRVFAHCFSRVGSRDDAEDLTGQVFEITWRRRADVRFDADADVLPWLLATANNLLSEHHRSVAKRSRLLRRLPRSEDVADHAADVAERDEFDQQLSAALAVLRTLRPADREVIELCVLHGLAPAVAARATGASASTVRTQLARALQRARTAYRSEILRADRAIGAEVSE